MERRGKIYEGKAKILYETDNPDLVIQYFKDEATAFDAQKRGIIEQKGIYNNRISSVLFEYLGKQRIRTHFNRSVWVNPEPADRWNRTQTADVIQQLFPMFHLSVDGIEAAITALVGSRPATHH